MFLEDVISTTENCRYCLMCRHVASVEQVTFKETHSPHGWGLIIASVRRGLLDWNEETVDALYSAPDHGNSRAHCVTDQPLPAAIAAARAEVVAQGAAPDVVYRLDEQLRQWANPYEKRAPETAVGQGEVALFVGDEAQYLWPAALEGALTLLRAAGVEPALIGRGRNSGYLASSLGLPETARLLAQATLDELQVSGARQLLVLSPGDYFSLGKLYDERLAIAWPETVGLTEVTAFLAGQLEAGAIAFRPLRDPVPSVYVDPTHAIRVPGRHEAPRRLLAAVAAAIDGRELFWRRERTHPAGNTALQFTQPDIARKLTDARLQDAAQTGAQQIICEDPGTLSHLKRRAELFGLEVQGLYELLAGQLVSVLSDQ